MKNTLLLLAICLLPLSLYAQKKDATNNYFTADSTWWNGLQLGINFSQASFSDNWKGGGVNSLALNTLFDYQLHYQNDPWSWDNQAEFLYGLIKNGNQQGIRKSLDRVYLDTKLGYQISEVWNFFMGANFLTQFAPGYRYVETVPGNEDALRISGFMAPAFLTGSLGFEYRPADYFWLRLSPLSSRLTFVTDTTLYLNMEEGKNYGVPVGETVRQEWLALQIVASFNKKLSENIKLQSRYMLFSNYDMFSAETIDHRLDVLFNAKLTQYINFIAGAILLYDQDQDSDVQISQTMGIGILFQK